MLSVREVALEAVQVDENVAMWTIICRSTVRTRLDCGKSSEILRDSNNVRLQLLTPGLIYYGNSYFDVSHLSRTFS